jgi:uncharacterized protein with PIN domain
MTRKDFSQQKIAYICQKENRTFITRKKGKHHPFYSQNSAIEIITSENIWEQLDLILSKYPVQKDLIATRCIDCNTPTAPLSTPHTPHLTYCPRCKKKYWHGSHYQNMLSRIEKYIHPHL